MAEPRALVLGVSVRPTCGMRDHAGLLAEELERRGVSCEFRWLNSGERTLGRARAEFSAWTAEVAAELERDPPDFILFHYSVFSYSYRGLPLFVAPAVAALRRSRAPVIAIMHELAYPFGQGGWRGRVWAVSHRIALAGLVRACSAVLVTAEFRAEWLRTRRWLPRRPVALAPVFSNLPAPRTAPPAQGGERVVGLFGYTFEADTVGLVLDALGLLRAEGSPARVLLLLGAPGGDSPVAERWRAAAAERGLADALSFSGMLPAQELADALGGCDVLLYADPTGPASRKGTLAGSLASGRPLVAVDGPRRWQLLDEERAAEIVARTPEAIAEAIARLLGAEGEREALGARGRAFAHERMGLARTADVVAELLAEIGAPGAQAAAAATGAQPERAAS